MPVNAFEHCDAGALAIGAGHRHDFVRRRSKLELIQDRNHAIERIYRDIRTFTLHFRHEQYMHQVGQAMLDEEFHAEGYAGASTFPESQSRA